MSDLSATLTRAAALIEQTKAVGLDQPMQRAIGSIVAALRAGLPLLVCGNGGSAADAMHIEAELVGRFLRERRALKVLALTANGATLTAWANDYAYEDVFARQVEAHGAPGAVLLGLSTSGNSANVVRAFETAGRIGMTRIAMTGDGGGKLAGLSDILFAVPSRVTAEIQQIHICLYHHLCAAIETEFAATERS